MRIQHNIMAMNAYRNYSNNTSALSKNLEKLSSGYKINRAGDDAAGLAISEKMRAQITGLKTAQKNAKDGISLVQTAEGALTEVHDMLNRALELADQSANGTYDNDLDRAQMQKELDQLRSEIDRIADSTNFNGIKLLDGSLDKKINDALGSTSGLIDNTDGMTVNAPVNGAGQKETVSIDLSADALFGAGDTFSFSFKTTVSDGTETTKTVDLSYDSGAAGSETYTANSVGNDTGKFGGATLNEQLDSIAKVLNHASSPLSAEYTASVKTDASGKAVGLTLTAKTEQVPTISINENSFTVADKQVTATKDDGTSKTGGSGSWVVHEAENMGVNNLLNAKAGSADAPDLVTGDKVQFTFNIDGNDRTVTLEAGRDFAIGNTVKETTQKLVEALNNAHFDDATGTPLLDESELAVGSYFTFAQNKNNIGGDSSGSIQATAKSGTAAALMQAKVTTSDGTLKGAAVTATVGQAAWTEKAAATATGAVTDGTLAGDIQLKDSASGNLAFDLSAGSDAVTNELKASLLSGDHTGDGAGVVEIDSTNGVSIKFVTNDTATGAVGEVNLDDSSISDVDSLFSAMNDAANAVSQSKHNEELAKSGSFLGSAPSVVTYELAGAAGGKIDGSSVTHTQAYSAATAMTDAPAKETLATDFTETFSAGNRVKVEGVLGDGRTFSIELEATDANAAGENQFKIGADTNASVDNIKDALANGANKVTITNSDGTTETVAADTIFKTDGTAQIKVSSSSGKLTLESNAAGVAGKDTNGRSGAVAATAVTVNAGDPITIAASDKQVGKVPGKAQNMITFDPEKVEQGTTMEIDGKTYEFVTNADFISKEGNIAVVVGKLGKRGTDGALASDAATGNDIANALKNAMDAQDAAGADGKYVNTAHENYNLTVDGNSLKIESVNEGTAAVALDVAAGTSRRDAAILKFATTETADSTKTNPKFALNVKVGDTVTINGKTYEFTDGVHRTKEEGNIGVSLKDIDTPQKAAHALADAVNAEDGGQVIAMVNEQDGSVTLTSKYNKNAYEEKGEDPYAAPEVSLPKDSNGLKLQIGDTAEEFNQLTVSVQDMHAKTLGIEDISISNQDSAEKAVDALKEAINMVSDVRGTLGATQNRLDHTINNLSVMQENIQDAESSIRDVDVAQEMMDYTKNNILVQSAQAMLAQANQVPQGVLQLLQ